MRKIRLDGQMDVRPNWRLLLNAEHLYLAYRAACYSKKRHSFNIFFPLICFYFLVNKWENFTFFTHVAWFLFFFLIFSIYLPNVTVSLFFTSAFTLDNKILCNFVYFGCFKVLKYKNNIIFQNKKNRLCPLFI